METAEIIPRFDDAEKALVYAFQMEARLLYVKTPYSEPIKGTNPLDLKQEERLADGLMIKNTALRALGVAQKQVILAEFTCPTDEPLLERKQQACEWLACEFIKDKPGVDKWLVVDVIKYLVGWQSDHDYDWWANHLKKSKSTIYRLAKSVKEFLEYWRNRAINLASITLYEENII